MPSDIKFSQFVNAVVIGVLFLLALTCFAYAVGLDLSYIINKDNWAGVGAVYLIFSFPAWRFISSFVGFLMEPVFGESTRFKRGYVLVFYGIRTVQTEARTTFLHSLASSSSQVDTAIKNAINSRYQFNLTTLSNEELYRVYDILRASLNLSSSTTLLSHQRNLSRNFHARLAVVANVVFWLTIAWLGWSFYKLLVLPRLYAWCCLLVAFVIGRFFGKRCAGNEEDYWLTIADFFALEKASEKKQ